MAFFKVLVFPNWYFEECWLLICWVEGQPFGNSSHKRPPTPPSTVNDITQKFLHCDVKSSGGLAYGDSQKDSQQPMDLGIDPKAYKRSLMKRYLDTSSGGVRLMGVAGLLELDGNRSPRTSPPWTLLHGTLNHHPTLKGTNGIHCPPPYTGSTGPLPPTPADSGVSSDVDSSSSGHTSNDDLKARLQSTPVPTAESPSAGGHGDLNPYLSSPFYSSVRHPHSVSWQPPADGYQFAKLSSQQHSCVGPQRDISAVVSLRTDWRCWLGAIEQDYRTLGRIRGHVVGPWAVISGVGWNLGATTIAGDKLLC